MKFKLTVSALIVAVAACTTAAESEHGDDALRRRGLVIGDQPLLIAEETPANTADVVVANDPAAVVPAVAGAQAPTMLLDSSFANLRNAPLGFVQMQQAPAAQQFMLTAGAAPGLGPAGVQRFVDAPQIFIQAQPAVSSVAPITIIQAMTAATMLMPAASAAAVVPATPATSTAVVLPAALTTPAAVVASASTAPAATPAAASVATSVAAPAPAPAAVAAPAPAPATAPAPAPVPAAVPAAVPAPAVTPAAPAVAPVAPAIAPIAPAAYQVPAPAYAPAAPVAPLSYSDMVLVPQPALAGIGEPPAAPAYAQQQLYPVAAAPFGQSAAQALAQAALQPATQPGLTALLAKEAAAAAAAAAAANVLPTAIISAGNASGSQATIPLDQSLADLLTQSMGLAAGQKTGAAAALARASALASADDDTADATQNADDDAATVEETTTSRRRQKPAVKSVSALARARKSKLDADIAADSNASAADDNADPDADASASAAAAETATGDDGALLDSSIVSRKRKTAAKTVSASTKKAAAKSTMDDDADAQLASGLHYRASPTVDSDDSLYDDASAVDSATDASYVRLPGSRQRSNIGNIKEEAARAKAEASAEAREAVLSEVRAEASAEAALQASAELHLSPVSVVHDEAALLERETSIPRAQQSFTRELAHGNFADEAAVSKAPEADSVYSPATERAPAAESDRSGAWDAPRAGGRSAYSEETPYYHAYEQAYSESRDKYSREQLPYTDLAKDSSMGGDWKIHYNGPSPTMYATGEDSSYTTYYTTEPHSSYSDSYKLHYPDEYQESERGYDSSSSKPFNFVNMHADSAFARDAASANPWDTPAADGHLSAATNVPHAVNDLDPLSYGTQACSFRNTLPLYGTQDYMSNSAHPSIMVIGVPQPAIPTMQTVQTVQTMPAVSAAPVTATATSTLMFTKYVTPAVKVVYGSSD